MVVVVIIRVDETCLLISFQIVITWNSLHTLSQEIEMKQTSLSGWEKGSAGRPDNHNKTKIILPRAA
jgi:hypothetical protein